MKGSSQSPASQILLISFVLFACLFLLVSRAAAQDIGTVTNADGSTVTTERDIRYGTYGVKVTTKDPKGRVVFEQWKDNKDDQGQRATLEENRTQYGDDGTKTVWMSTFLPSPNFRGVRTLATEKIVKTDAFGGVISEENKKYAKVGGEIIEGTLMIVDPGGKKTIKKYDPKTRTYKAVEPPKEDETPKQIVPTSFGLFGGFSYLRSPDETAQNLDGFTSSLFYNITPHVGVGGEFTGVSGSAQVGTTTDVSLQRQLYQFGPQFSFYANPKVSVVVYLLFGGVHDTSKTTIGTSSTSFSANAFAMAFGGGVDVNLNNHFAIRPIQFDYVRTRFGGVWQNNLRFSTGVVVHIGKRVHTE